MRIFTFLIGMTFFGSVLSGQSVSDSVILGPSYANQSYYSLSSGEVSNVAAGDWDIAFEATGYTSSIRINAALGTELFMYSAGDTSDWASLDSSGLSSWPKYYNDDASWSAGAFNRTADGMYDQGWGNYSMITHHVTGDSLYIIKLSNGDYKKIWIQSLAGGVYSFKYANLDGSSEVNASVVKSSFSGKNFAYYSLISDTVIDREPDNTTWDLVFTKYVSEVMPGMPYGVTGVLSNATVSVAEASGVSNPSVYSNHSAHTFETSINIIGYDWKSFNMTTYLYDLDTSTCYFVTDVDGDIWRVVMTGFGGSSNGQIEFLKENLTSVSSSNIYGAEESKGLVLYPNPASSDLNVVYNSNYNHTNLIIYDISGKAVDKYVFDELGLNNLSIDLTNYSSGLYIIELVDGDIRMKDKFIVK